MRLLSDLKKRPDDILMKSPKCVRIQKVNFSDPPKHVLKKVHQQEGKHVFGDSAGRNEATDTAGKQILVARQPCSPTCSPTVGEHFVTPRRRSGQHAILCVYLRSRALHAGAANLPLRSPSAF